MTVSDYALNTLRLKVLRHRQTHFHEHVFNSHLVGDPVRFENTDHCVGFYGLFCFLSGSV
jgi:hypothetical protein